MKYSTTLSLLVVGMANGAHTTSTQDCAGTVLPNGTCSQAPTQEWICGEFRQKVIDNMATCRADVENLYEDIKKYPASSHNVNQFAVAKRLDKGFHYYCGEPQSYTPTNIDEIVERRALFKLDKEEALNAQKEREIEEDGRGTDVQNAVRARVIAKAFNHSINNDVEGRNFATSSTEDLDADLFAEEIPDEDAPEFTLNNGKFSWYEPEEQDKSNWPELNEFNANGWYGRLVVPLQKQWNFCNQSKTHAVDIMAAKGQTEMVQLVRDYSLTYRQQQRTLVNIINPRRVHGRHQLRHVLHLGELLKISERYSTVFSDIDDTLTELAEGSAHFCSSFDADLEFIREYGTHSEVLDGMYNSALAAEDGATGVARKDIREMRGHLMKSWQRIKSNFDCAFEHEHDSEELLAAYSSIYNSLANFDDGHSVRGYLRYMVRDTDYTHAFKTDHAQTAKDNCWKGSQIAMKKVNNLMAALPEEGEWLAEQYDVYNIWLLGSGSLDIFLNNWNKAKDANFDHTMNWATRGSELYTVAAELQKMFQIYSRVAIRADNLFGADNEKVSTIAAAIDEHAWQFKQECIDEVRHIASLLTPQYRTKLSFGSHE